MPQRDYFYSSVFASANLTKVENMNSAIQIAFTAMQTNNQLKHLEAQNTTKTWSEWFDISNDTKYLHEYFIRVPGYGDVAIHLEPIANTCHIYIDPISELEVPAKEIRSRFFSSPQQSSPISPSTVATAKHTLPSPKLETLSTDQTNSEASDLLDTSTNGEESFVTIPALEKSKLEENASFHSMKSPAATVYGSCNNTYLPESTDVVPRYEVNTTAFLDEISFILW